MGSIGNNAFSQYSVNNGLPTVVMGGSDAYNKNQELEKNIQKAKDAGYEVVLRKYTKRGGSGQLYEFEESNIATPVKNGAISKTSNLWKHAQNTATKYSDVIVMQSRSAVEGHTRARRGGFTSTGKEAQFVVLARRKK